MTKVQLALTNQEADILRGYGAQFGYSLPKTIRFLISKTAEEVLRSGMIPTYQIDQKLEEKGLQALKEHGAGQTIKVKDPQEFFNQL